MVQTERELVFDEIIRERMSQDAEHGGPPHDDSLSENEWIAILARHVGLAAGDKAEVNAARFRRQMIRVAACAVAAVESFDRRHTAGPKTPSQLGKGF